VRILFVSINYWPDETGIAAFNVWRAEYLASRGHRVSIATGPPYYPEWRVPEPYRGLPWERRAWRTEERNGVRILRSPMFVPKAVSAKTRILHEASFLASSFARAFTDEKPELIFAVSPPLGLAVTVSTLARLWGVPYVIDVEDLQPDAAIELGMMREGRLTRALYRVERLGYERATLVGTITEGMRQRIVAKGVDLAKVVLFPPRGDSSLYEVRRACDAEGFRRRHGLEGKFVVSHSGNMGVKQGLEVILGAAERSRTRRPELHYLFVGDGAMRARLEAQARRRSLANVTFLPLLARDDFRQMLASTDLALVTQQRVVSNIVFPSKTVTLFSAGCPVVASVNAESEVARAVRDSGAGEVVEPEDGVTLFEAIDRLSRAPETLAQMSAAGQSYAQQHWDERRTLPRMEEQLMGCVQRWRSAKGR
jgi:colanic acid biosynthesis glycosyl transferase WcaI